MNGVISSKQGQQIKNALSHPLKALHDALPTRSKPARIARGTALAALAATTRKHPLLCTAATMATLGLGWWYYKRRHSNDDIQPSADAQRCDCSEVEEERKRPAKAGRKARATTANDEASAEASRNEEDAAEADERDVDEHDDASDTDERREH